MPELLVRSSLLKARSNWSPGGLSFGSTYPQLPRPARALLGLLPLRALLHLLGPGRCLGRLPGPSHHQSRLGDHRPLCRARPQPCVPPLQLRRLELGRGLPRPPGPAAGDLRPRRARLAGRRRHPVPQAGGQSRLRRHLPGRRAVQQEAQDLPLWHQLGHPRPDHRVALPPRPLLLREHLVAASWLPGRQLIVVGDSAYLGKHLLKGLPEKVAALGPIHWKAELTGPLPHGYVGRRKKGDKLATPKQAMADDRWPWRCLVLRHPKGEKALQVKTLGPCCWYNSAGQRPLQVVLVRDPDQKWRDEALLCGDLELSAEEVIVGYLRRWSVEVAYGEAKQMLGFHDPMVWSEQSVGRAHPMAWFTGSLVVLWYARVGRHEPQAHRHRPWYKDKVSPTFADMLACCRLHLWQNWLQSEPERAEGKLAWLLEYLATAP